MSVPPDWGRKVMSSRQYMRASFLGGYELLDAVAEEDDTHLVVVGDGAEGECGGHLGGQLFFELLVGAEAIAAADVDEQHDGEFALLLEHLDIGVRQAGGDVPVDVAQVVGILVFAHLAEGHATPFEGGVVLAAEHLLRQSPRLDLNLAYLLDY